MSERTPAPREAILAALKAPFPAAAIGWKPQTISKDGKRALAVAYIDARDVMNRLDEVLGLGRWQATYREFGAGICCSLSIFVEGEWSEQEDAGNFSDQPDEGDKLKAAFSDALKRAAIHFGVGRYLYSLPKQWADWDAQKRDFVKPPGLPEWALPAAQRPQQKPGKALPPNPINVEAESLEILKGAATKGTEALKAAWQALPAEIRDVLQPHIEELKVLAASVKPPNAKTQKGVA